MTIKTATEFQIQPLPEQQKVILSFRTPPDHTQVEISMSVATEVMATMAHCLVSNPNEDARRASVQRLSVRNISAGLWNGMPAISYELEIGIAATTSIELLDAIRLRDQLTALIDAAPQGSALSH